MQERKGIIMKICAVCCAWHLTLTSHIGGAWFGGNFGEYYYFLISNWGIDSVWTQGRVKHIELPAPHPVPFFNLPLGPCNQTWLGKMSTLQVMYNHCCLNESTLLIKAVWGSTGNFPSFSMHHFSCIMMKISDFRKWGDLEVLKALRYMLEQRLTMTLAKSQKY